MKGRLSLDEGAVKVLSEKGRSLLPVGVVSLSGSFRRGDMVVCVDSDGNELARGLVNYNAEDTQKLMGVDSRTIEKILGFTHGPELIHRDNLVLI